MLDLSNGNIEKQISHFRGFRGFAYFDFLYTLKKKVQPTGKAAMVKLFYSSRTRKEHHPSFLGLRKSFHQMQKTHEQVKGMKVIKLLKYKD